MNIRISVFILVSFICSNLWSQTGEFKSYVQKEHEVEIETTTKVKLRVQLYNAQTIRFQWANKNEDFFPDDHYEMVEHHKKSGKYSLEEDNNFLTISINNEQNTKIKIQKSPLKYTVISGSENEVLLGQKEGIKWIDNLIINDLQLNTNEHFCGVGHQTYGWVESIDLKGKKVNSNYGEGIKSHYQKQAVLTVPFFMSNKGYGIFLNSTFEHDFDFGSQGQYQFSIDTKGFEGRMDYFVIIGPDFKDILYRYTQLTGRPRFLPKSIFGLQLSDKEAPDNNGAEWWKEKITAHRKAGYAFDHIVNDNRWRAGSGAWSGSWFEWDSIRYPDPSAYLKWCKENNLTVTLDLNRNIGADSYGWKPEYNLPYAEQFVKEGHSAPDYSNPETRKWVWKLFWEKSLNPKLNYGGDALWIDETDEMYTLPDTVICANGRSWAENKNYYPFLIAKAIVQEGWDSTDPKHPGIGEAKRPFVWVRSMTAGAQRYASHWNGDIYSDCEWMKTSIRAMQASGLSGFPYFNHDAGGFIEPGPEDFLYNQWAMAFGSFSPIWRPHGMGKHKRWPLDRSEASQKVAMQYIKERYELMPYIYTYAFKAHETGIPMAKAMVIDYQDEPNAWKYDLQYMWGNEMLIAPVCSKDEKTIDIWLPKGQKWYNYWTNELVNGNQILKHRFTNQNMPIFVKEGSIIPKQDYALSTFSLNPKKINLHIYTGKDAQFELHEDDGVTEKFNTKNEKRSTKLNYIENGKKLIIHASEGNYEGAVSKRSYKIYFYGFTTFHNLKLNGKEINSLKPDSDKLNQEPITYWDDKTKTQVVELSELSVNKDIVLMK
ncbi:TIM-barrel domain-containing protein [Winogradskyella sp. A3E31]|uniref:glycoside hydrolase family 31 protein n=1 Tax=Winogradskyella sp. A3E31 TaxID=3349637 RepID=UPI00398B01B7